jgi:hypothetical protein
MRGYSGGAVRGAVAASTLLLVACGDGGIGGGGGDGSDAGSRDSGSGTDAGTGTDAAAFDASGSDPDAGTPADAGTEVDAGDDCVEGECCYELVHESPGLFHTVTEADPQHVVRPLEAGEGFFCMRVEYTMQTVDNLVETDAAYEGCPIFSHIGGIAGGGAEGRVVGGAFFRMLRLGCSVRRPVAVQLDVWAPAGEERSTTLTGPWLPGETYRIVQEVVPFTSAIELYQDGALVGPRIETDISGTTVNMTRDTEVAFGLDAVYDGAYFPYFDAVYSDLEIWADVAAAP